MKKYLLFSISFLLLIISCKKDEIDLHKYPGLPDATQSGENTMGCLINGKPWVAQKEGSTIGWPTFTNKVDCFYGELRKNIPEVDKYFLEMHFSIRKNYDQNEYKVRENININLKPVLASKKININKINNKLFEYYFLTENNKYKTYYIDSLANNFIEITKLDTINNIVSGLFDFKVISTVDIKDTLRLSMGRFDANYCQNNKKQN